MEKSYLKHVLVLLDHDEIRGIDFDQAVSDVFQELHRESSRAPAREQVRLDIQEIIDACIAADQAAKLANMNQEA